MRSSGHLLKRAGREFAKNIVWMAVVFGSMAAVLAAATDLSLIGLMAFVGVSVAVMAAIVTVVLWSGAHDEPRFGGHDDPSSPPETRGGDWPGGGWWDGGGGGDGGSGWLVGSTDSGSSGFKFTRNSSPSSMLVAVSKQARGSDQLSIPTHEGCQE
jgi:hypothetical protein